MTWRPIASRPDAASESRQKEPDLAALCRTHGVALELVEQSRDVDDLVDRVLDDYLRRTGEVPGDPLPAEARLRLRALVSFTRQATAMNARAVAAVESAERATAFEASSEDTAKGAAEVLRAVGVLTHGINNPLTALIGRVQLLRLQGDLPPRAMKSLDVLEESSMRIAELARELGAVVKEGRRAIERVPGSGTEAGSRSILRGDGRPER